MSTILTAKRLSDALAMNDMRAVDLAEKTGLNKASISQYLHGRCKPSNIASGKMASVLGVSPVWLMGFDVPMFETNHNSKGVRIPVLGRVAAGIPISAVEEIIDEEEISQDMALKGEYFGLVIKGDSMEPDMRDGDIAIVRKQDDAESGEIVIAIVDSEDAVCKKLIKTDSGVMLVSLNHRYDPMVFAHVQIVGKVVELRRKF